MKAQIDLEGNVSTAVTTIESRDIAATERPADIMSLIARAASDPSMDVEKMERLFALKERLDAQLREEAFNNALARAQQRCPQITQRGKAHNNIKYAKLEHIDEAIRHILAEEGLSIEFDTQPVQGSDKCTNVIAMVRHNGGFSKSHNLVVPDDAGGAKNAIQARTSAISYARRTLTKNWFNVVECGDDDNGNGGTITADQADTINAMLGEIGAGNRPKFLEFMGVDSLDKIPAKEYERAISKLNQKRSGQR